jgi:hypothetical protein
LRIPIRALRESRTDPARMQCSDARKRRRCARKHLPGNNSDRDRVAPSIAIGASCGMQRSCSRLPSSSLLIAAGSLLAALGCGTNHSSGAGSTPDSGSSQGSSSSQSDAGTTSSTDGAASTNAFDCSGAGIAAYADQLVNAARTTCTKDGVGVVKEDDYTCMSSAINQLAPPYASASFNVVSTLLADDTQYPFYECTYFVQTVTAGVCNVPISPSNTPWTDYPFACSFIDQPVQGFEWIDKTQGVVQVGDILLYTSSDNCRNDPGHIMIVAQVIDSNHFRIAEANDLTVNGTAGNGMDTGVVSNTRIETLDDPYLASGWFRHD